MKIISQTFLMWAALTLFSSSLYSENVYIMFDQACMDRLEYGYGFTAPGQEYVKYHIKISASEVIVFEVGPENNSPKQNYLNTSTITCDDEGLSRELVKNQRENVTEVFIVRQIGNGQFQVSKVNNSSYFRRDAQGVQYDSWQMSFNHLGGLTENENLTPNSTTGVNILFQGIKPYECTEAYLFKRTYDHDTKSYSEVYFLPRLGIVEERPYPGGADGIYKLRAVNGEPFKDVLDKICRSSLTLSSDFLGVASGAGAGTANTSPAQEFHDVALGETLFSISRQYNVKVEDIQNWNNLSNSNVVRVGQRLRIAPPGGTAPAAATGIAADDGFNWGGANNSTANSTGIQPYAAAGAAATTSTAAKGGKPWEMTTGVHQVQAGETVALLALRYGYTEDRFRYMNNLGPNDMVMVGQQVKTTDCPPATTPKSITPYQGNQQVPPSNGFNQYQQPAPASGSAKGYSDPLGATALGATTSTTAANNSTPVTNTNPFTAPAPANPSPPVTNTSASSANNNFEPYFGGNSPDFGGSQPVSSNTSSIGSGTPQTQPYTPPSSTFGSTSTASSGAVQPFTPPSSTFGNTSTGSSGGLQPFTPPSSTPSGSNSGTIEPFSAPSTGGAPIEPFSPPASSGPANQGSLPSGATLPTFNGGGNQSGASTPPATQSPSSFGTPVSGASLGNSSNTN